jgi:hypothetical protein
MSYITIDTNEAVFLFDQFMKPNGHIDQFVKPNNRTQILGLVGDGKMGKTHLLTKVFPSLAQQKYSSRVAILDLRYQFHNVPEIIDLACSQFDQQCFEEGYYTADQAWINRPKVKVKGLHTIFSHVDIAARDGIDDARDRDRFLTTQFVKDVGKLSDRPLLLLFDSIDKANEAIKMWLMEMLLVKLSRLDHVRVVVAGRFLPDPYTSYRALCKSYRLLPVKEIEAYITYCKSVDPTLSEQLIRILAHAFDYVPGLFVEALPKFTSHGLFNG